MSDKASQTLFTIRALFSFVSQKKSERRESDRLLKIAERAAEGELFEAIDGSSDANPGRQLRELKSLKMALSDARTDREASLVAFRTDIDGGSRAMTSMLIPESDGRQMSIDMAMIEGDGIEVFPEDAEVVRSAVEFYTDESDAEISEIVLARIGQIENASLQAAND